MAVERAPTGGRTYGLRELAALTGIPARTIRYYQSLGLLPLPRKQGREAVYDEEHRDRLRLIGEMRERGLRLSAIQDLLSREGQVTRTVIDWLGIEDTVRRPWTDDGPRVYTAEEMAQQLAGLPDDTLARMRSTGMVQPADSGDGGYMVTRPGLFQVTLRLMAAGIDFPSVVLAGEILRGYLAGAAGSLTMMFDDQIRRRQLIDGASPAEVVVALEGLKDVVQEAAGLLFAYEIDRAVKNLLAASGRANQIRP